MHFRILPLFSVLISSAVAAALDVKPEVRALHERVFVMDTHFDTATSLARAGWDVTRRHSYAEDFTQVDLPRLIEGGVDGGFWTIYTPQGPRTPEGLAAARDAALQTALRIHKMVAAHPTRFEIALRADDAARIVAAGKHVVFLSIENGYPLGRDLTLIKTFQSLGVRLLGLVHTTNNDVGDSASDPKGKEWGGLSPFGREVVAEANRLGLALDPSHASDAVLDQVLELSTTPVILSHSGCKAVFDHPRNVPDDLLRKVAAKGGVIQMNAFSSYVAKFPVSPERNAAQRDLFAKIGGRAALATPEGAAAYLVARREFEKKFPRPLAPFDAFFAHVLHALKVVGPDHVGISGDFDGGGGVEGFDDVSDAPRITAALVAAGYTEGDITKIWGGNVLRVLRAAEAAAANAKPSAPAAAAPATTASP
jgi:membrane dipeptidase